MNNKAITYLIGWVSSDPKQTINSSLGTGELEVVLSMEDGVKEG